ncbi:type I restriction enzyme EcoKI subunit R [Planctomycetes bacterium CA13]|uniref:Type I restriction enzyme EcoKI subunit R n=1 Tax=Novipirellula herctigrandis TaxID=2527986 RepID=A0A5C5Z1I2_9BACT|nr:type I restriction enzyme EcoKI subunit R [Planctomycetes bacterium CA13]
MEIGLYDHLLTKTIEDEIARLGDPRLAAFAPVDSEEAHSALAQFLERMIAGSLAAFRGDDAAEKQRQLTDRILSTLAEALHDGEGEVLSIASPLRRLLAIHRSVDGLPNERPASPLSRCSLLTGTRLDTSLGSQLRKEIATCDRVDILCSFIKWSGLRVIVDELRELVERNDELAVRVITTSYMGATDPKAVAALSELPRTEVRVSYDTKRTRLHAKAYLFHRKTGFSSAYVGSANLSNAALSEGLEWTTKISQYELPYLWDKVTGTFETYWQDDEFQAFDIESLPRLRQAISTERKAGTDTGLAINFDLRPFPFQEEILDIIAAERDVQNKYRHLIVAATGTGKTMIAAFDYARVARELGRKPRLLFIAHRKEILSQAMVAFRCVLRDQNFGDLLVDGSQPEQHEHLFCSIQSYNSRNLQMESAEQFEYVVVDEFHHAAAPSYQSLLDHVKPRVLLGLTATPERSDQLDVLSWFGGRASAEIRLPDAISRRLLCPFQYFGISDAVDLDGLTWQRGGYRIDDLDRLYTGNDVRAKLVFEKVAETVLDSQEVRGLGFCCSVAHAEFMARFFDENGIPSIALSAGSTKEERNSAQQRLRDRSVNFIFVVDLYNEGIDIPEVDTVLLLRPTESLTVFLQQLGRGLRLHPEKECLTVLDFIGAQRKEFRFASRFRALSDKPTAKLDVEIESGFPHLPSGCVIKLERVAQQRVLENVRESIRLVRPRMLSSLRDLKQYLGRVPTLEDALDYFDTTLDELLKRGLWSRLLADAGLAQVADAPDEKQLAKGLRRLSHINCPLQIQAAMKYIEQDAVPENGIAEMLHVSLWGTQHAGMSLSEADKRLRENSVVVDDLQCVLEYRLKHSPLIANRNATAFEPLAIHATYTRDEILVALGHWNFNDRPSQREGVLHLKDRQHDVFFVTLQKTEDEYSPTTMYEDYLISHNQFHWQSQSNTSEQSPTGQRYIRHGEKGYTPLLFVRETKNLPSGISAPYHFLGPCRYLSHTGSRPISIIWELEFPVPTRLLRTMARQIAV